MVRVQTGDVKWVGEGYPLQKKDLRHDKRIGG